MNRLAESMAAEVAGNLPERGWLQLEARYSRLVLLLQQHRQRDRELGLSEERIGWTTKAELAAEVAELTEYALEPRSVGTYLSNIQQMSRQWFGQDVKLIQYQRKRGLRLAQDIEIIDGRSGDVGQGGWRLDLLGGTADQPAFLGPPSPGATRPPQPR